VISATIPKGRLPESPFKPSSKFYGRCVCEVVNYNRDAPEDWLGVRQPSGDCIRSEGKLAGCLEVERLLQGLIVPQGRIVPRGFVVPRELVGRVIVGGCCRG
jgi:hypothetical protein